MDIQTLNKIMNKAYENQKSILLIGRYGIGKSQIIYDWAINRANKENREFIAWHNLTEEEKYDVLNNIDKYFIFVDIKLQTIGDISKISGVPIIHNHSEQTKIIWEQPLFLKVLSNEKSKGVLFLDEINMAVPSLQSIAFEITLQRKVSEWKISDNVLIIGAGNDLESNISANPIPKPLLNRVLLVKYDGVDVDSWIKWASNNNIDNRIISFVKLFQDLMNFNQDDMEQSTTPRSYELLSDMIKNENDKDFIEMCAFGYLNEITASKFIKYIELMDKLDYKKYIDNPKLFTELKVNEQYALLSIITKHFKQINKEKLVKFITHLSKTTTELSAVLLALIKSEYGMRNIKPIIEKLDMNTIDKISYLIN